MSYKQSFDTFIRIYDGLGYIANRATFADRVCNKSGAVFLWVLSREPQTLDQLLPGSARDSSQEVPSQGRRNVAGFCIFGHQQCYVLP